MFSSTKRLSKFENYSRFFPCRAGILSHCIHVSWLIFNFPLLMRNFENILRNCRTTIIVHLCAGWCTSNKNSLNEAEKSKRHSGQYHTSGDSRRLAAWRAWTSRSSCSSSSSCRVSSFYLSSGPWIMISSWLWFNCCLAQPCNVRANVQNCTCIWKRNRFCQQNAFHLLCAKYMLPLMIY